MINLRLFLNERHADGNFTFDVNGRKFSKIVRNTVRKGEIAHYNFSFSPQFSRDLYSRHIKTMVCLGSVIFSHQNFNYQVGDRSNLLLNILPGSKYLLPLKMLISDTVQEDVQLAKSHFTIDVK